MKTKNTGNYEAVDKVISDTLFLFFGSDLEKSDSGDNWEYHRNKDFFVAVQKGCSNALISIDLKSCYNKESQMPIHFSVELGNPISNRKMKRICQAITFLMTHRKDAGGFFGSLPGFDDLDSEQRQKFYLSK